MREYLLFTGISSSLILLLFLSGVQIDYQQENHFLISSNDEDIILHNIEEDVEDNANEDIEVM